MKKSNITDTLEPVERVTKKVKKASKEQIANLLDKKSKVASKQEKVDAKTTAVIIKKVTTGKELLYAYPEDCTEPGQKKIFRAKARKGLAKLEKNLRLISKGKVEGKVTDVEKAIELFKSQYYKK
jgi:hypothetical protein